MNLYYFIVLVEKHIDFLLLRKMSLHIDLETPQHERFEQPVDLLDDLLLMLRVVLVGFIDHKQIVKIVSRFEQLWHQEVQERPQLLQVVLKRGACKQDAASSTELAKVL